MDYLAGDFDLDEFLCHFNPNHDPKNGQFAKSPNGSRSIVTVSTNNQSSKSTADNPKTSRDSDDADHEKLKKYLKIGGIALGSALVVLGARYLIDDAVKAYAKRHGEGVIEAGTTLATVSFNPDDTLTENTMFFASFKKRDRTLYEALFNTPVSELKGKNGEIIATGGPFLKKRILRAVTQDIKYASEDEGVSAFAKLCKTDPRFSDWVFDYNSGMQSLFEPHRYRYSGYRMSRRELQRVISAIDRSQADYSKLYPMFNYVLTKSGSSEFREKFFRELGSRGFDGVLDTNDALYGAYNANAPVILFNMKKIAALAVEQTTMDDRRAARGRFIMNKLFGLNL